MMSMVLMEVVVVVVTVTMINGQFDFNSLIRNRKHHGFICVSVSSNWQLFKVSEHSIIVGQMFVHHTCRKLLHSL